MANKELCSANILLEFPPKNRYVGAGKTNLGALSVSKDFPF